jgi:hypothetical protein
MVLTALSMSILWGGPVKQASAGIRTDVEVHLKKLDATADTDWPPRGWPDPYVIIEVCGQERTMGPFPESNPEKGKDIHSSARVTFKCEDVSVLAGGVRVKWWVYDDDPWGIDEKMTEGDDRALYPQGEVLKSSGPSADIELEVTYHDYCTIAALTGATCTRAFASVVDPGQAFGVTTSIDVVEADPPAYVTSTEVVPENFAYVSSSPPATISQLTIDGYDYTTLEWTFSGAELFDRNVTYTLVAPETAGTYSLTGQLETDRMAVGQMGQERIYVGRAPGGATELTVGGPDSAAGSASGSGPSVPYAALAGGAAAALVAVLAGGWYARRRWLR